jgi:apolipoprotein N-acyltransferase
VPPPQADPEPAGRPQADVLPRLRLTPSGRPWAIGIALAAAGGALTWLANPPADLGALALVSLIPLLVALRGASPQRGAVFGFVFALVSFGLLLRWLVLFGWIAEWPLVVVQAAFVAAFGAAAAAIWRRVRGVPASFLIAAAWTATEWLRGVWPLGGFTWGGLGYTQHANPAVLPLASVTGVWGISFVVILTNLLLLEGTLRLVATIRGRRSAGAWGRAALPFVIAAVAVVGPWVLPVPAPDGPALDVAVVQGSVPRALASDRLLQTSEVAASHIRLHRTLAGDPPDLAVWPENALAEDPASDPVLGREVAASIRAVGAPTLVGAIRSLPGRRYANQTLLYDGQGRVVGRYTKVHLVPFGEYVPWRRFFAWTERYRQGNVDLVPGRAVRVFRIDGTVIGTPICFENTFPDLFRRFVAMGANVMIVTTNDSSYLLTEASREHVIFSQLRAVETGRWVVQAAISGESAVVDPRGRIVARTGLFARTILRASVPTGSARTIYVRLGDWFPFACVLVTLAAVAALVSRARGGRPGAGDARGSARTRSAGVAPPPAGEGREAAPIAGAAEPRVLVVIPTYDERATIGAVLEGVRSSGPNVDVLVVDDGSPDGTGDLVAAVAVRDRGVRLIRRDGKRGLASAYLAGFDVGLADGYDVIVEMDADLSHRPQDLAGLIEGSARFDLTIGSRYVPGGRVTNWSRSRLALSRAGNAYTRAMLRIPVKDATSGFRAYRRALLASLVAAGVTSEGYGFQIELVRSAYRLGARIGEVPITFQEREHGHSKISRRIVVEALAKVGTWGIQDRLHRRPARRTGPDAGDADAVHPVDP